MITCIHQRNEMSYFDVPVYKSLLDNVCNNVGYGSTIYIQTNIGHMTGWMEEYGFIHKSINHSQR
jgi:hypothetical protein